MRLKAIRLAIRVPALALLALAGVLAAACGGGETARDAAPPSASTTEAGATSQPASGVGAPRYDFPTGTAVTVAAGYSDPGDHVPSTGAYLPVNGQPTVVFVDAIW